MTWNDVFQFTIFFGLFGEFSGILVFIAERLFPTGDKDLQSLFNCMFLFPLEVAVSAFLLSVVALLIMTAWSIF